MLEDKRNYYERVVFKAPGDDRRDSWGAALGAVLLAIVCLLFLVLPK